MQASAKGRYEVVAWNAKGDVASDLAVCTVVIGGVPPVPPDPGPNPPVPPVPPPSPAPIPVDGFRALIVYESAELGKMPATQTNILYTKEIRDYLNSKTVKGTDGKTGEWRIWDKDVDTTNETKLWQDVMKRPRTAVPWLVISTGKDGFEGPLPATVADTLTLLKKYGG